MDSGKTTTGIIVLALLAACGSGGGGGGGGGGAPNPGAQPLTGNLGVVRVAPADGATQVPVDTAVEVELDAAPVSDCLNVPDTGLWDDAGNPVAGSLSQRSGGNTVVFMPSAPLAEQTTYTFKLSPFTCDATGRILDQSFAVTFRTTDDTAPSMLASSPRNGQTGVSRTAPVRLTFSESLDPASVTAAEVHLDDSYGGSYPVDLQLTGGDLAVTPAVDLPGERRFALRVDGVRDLAGNSPATAMRIDFTTARDIETPTPVDGWPTGAGVSPLVQPVLTFSESMDPASVEPNSVLFVDNYSNVVAFAVQASRDQRRLRLVPRRPLAAGRTYALNAINGPGGITDLSGNPLAKQLQLAFATGSDDVAPSVTAIDPADGATRVGLSSELRVSFDEAIDPASITTGSVVLAVDGSTVATTAVLEVGGTELRVTPDQPLRAGALHTLTLPGGQDGLRDLAGNPLAADVAASFRTTTDPTVPSVLLEPYDGNRSVPTTVTLSALFDEPVDPATVDGSTVYLYHDGGIQVPGTVTLSRGNRLVRFTPSVPWNQRAAYVFTVAGGPNGIREASGNWLPADAVAHFTTSALPDYGAPSVDVTLNGIDDQRKESLTVPPSGFDIDVRAIDHLGGTLDMGTVEVAISGSGGPVPGVETIFRAARVDGSTLHYTVPAGQALQPGDYQVEARVRDLSGNLGTTPLLDFHVADPDPGSQPFERTQVVWVRFDLDRDGNGRPDHEDDLLRLGLMTAGDPSGTNARMAALVRDAILTQAHAVFGRDPSGAPGPGAVPLRLTWRQVPGARQAQIACGGLDPEGDPTRTYGAASTGTLGRAYFDYRNGNMTDVNTGTSPGLGVFPGELYLFETKLHTSVYPSYTTTFARRFLNLAPAMGGIPAGSHPLDPVVLAPGFDPTTATSTQLARYRAVFDAADDWAAAIGIILAHEIGHTVGLVARGGNPRGLHGDASLHNEFSSATDIMASAVGYDSLVSLSYAFRDLNITYLRQRLLMK